MRLRIDAELTRLLDLIKAEAAPNQQVFIVGGGVRDLLLGRPLHDLDFAMARNPTPLAKRLAGRLGVGFYVLDDERKTARVVYRDHSGRDFPLDFVRFTGGNLHEDLKNRDFTINAMAIQLDNRSEIIDPLEGQTDLKLGVIRLCTERALLDDPVRVLRGIRLARQFNFSYASGLEGLMREASSFLPRTSYERQRDEFFRILSGPLPAEGLRDCHQFDVFETLLPPLIDQASIPPSPPHVFPLLEHSINTVAFYDQLLGLLKSDLPGLSNQDWRIEQVYQALAEFTSELKVYFSDEITPGREKQALAMFGALLHDIGKPITVKSDEGGRLYFHHHASVGGKMAWEMARRLQLSNAESEWVRKMVRHHMALLPLINAEKPPTRRDIFRFFTKTHEVGVSISILSLADTLATYGKTLDRANWHRAVNVTRDICEAWWHKRDTLISPELLLNGHDLQDIFGLSPGKKIGRLLGQLREAQACGEVLTKDEATAFIREQLAEEGEPV